ncbi:type II secretion system F family protein [Thioclava sp. JE_KL1]|uniref:type II secretion system F family protein n=1 Tax=Thioclava sp. JE_KL1 TaxID=2651187 RepID=UPI00128BB375|nr:type II secretion system F family protein [Thioclava sp. JE_KL1]MPQ95981.1 hypothetical protein [Thioclava sp. JE_KL1]
MTPALGLSVIMALGGASLLAAGLVWFVDEIARHRQRLADRYAGRQPNADTISTIVEAPRELLRSSEREGPIWQFIGLSPMAFAAFRADQPRFLWPAIAGLVAAVSLLLMRLLGASLFWALPLMIALYASGIFLAARMHGRQRLIKIEERLPEALDIIARCLRIGMPINASLRVVAQDLTGIIAQEFTVTADQISYGKDMVGALREMATRTNSTSLRFLAAAVAIQSETGGNLVEVVERIANLARARIQLQRKIRAMTAEAIWSGRFLSAFPVVASFLIAVINPSYFDNLYDKPYLIPLVLLIGALLLANIVFMHRLVRFD